MFVIPSGFRAPSKPGFGLLGRSPEESWFYSTDVSFSAACSAVPPKTANNADFSP
jgi:hypothetical protein